MRPLSRSRTNRPTFVVKVRLPLAAAITTVLVVISFSPRARSEGGVDQPPASTIYLAEVLKNELPVEHPRWKILVLIYDKTDAVLTDTRGVTHHMVGAMARSEIDTATLAATAFVETDIPALTSGNMIPELTVRYPQRALTQLDSFGEAWWPSPANTLPERDPAFDSVIVIWDPRVVDQFTGTEYWIGGAAGLAVPMGVDQTYATLIIEATGYPHRNVFKHEWGHSILFYFEAAGTAPRPTVTNHAVINQYVHWPSGEAYVWADETEANPIPNSIYNNESGFTHDYYSGTTATADEPARRLGITPEAWMLGGPVTKPRVGSPPINDTEPPVFVHIPPPLTVTTGPGATSCGTVVEDARLRSTAPGSDSVILDPTGDLSSPLSSPGHDIVSSDARFDAGSLTFAVSFAGQVFPASFGDSRSLLGFIDIDTDQNPATGGTPLFDPGSPRLNLGVEFRIDLVSEFSHPGFVDIRTGVGSVVVGTVPIVFADTSFRITVPLALLSGDNGLVNYSVHMGVFGFGQTDRLPNGTMPVMSVPVSELIAIDAGAGVTITRSGVPFNNFFPVGETLLTYTATDASGNVATVTQIVTVIDNTSPVISGATVSPSTLWPPNHDMVDVAVNYEVADNCALSETRLLVSSNEPATDRGGSDWQIVDAHHVRLRAARSGRSGDRVYTITITAKDVSGNLSTQDVTVTVPHSKRKEVARTR